LWDLHALLYASESINNTGILPDYLREKRQVQQELEKAQNISAPFPPPMALSPSNPRGENLTDTDSQRLLSAKGRLWDLQALLYAAESNPNTDNLQDYMCETRKAQKILEEIQLSNPLYLIPRNLTRQPPPSITIAAISKPKSLFDPPYDWKYRDKDRNSILHLAVATGSYEQCRDMQDALNLTVEFLPTNIRGESPFHIAIYRLRAIQFEWNTVQDLRLKDQGYGNYQLPKLESDLAEANRICVLFPPPKVTQSPVQQNPVTRVMMPRSSTGPVLSQETKVPKEPIALTLNPTAPFEPPYNLKGTDEKQNLLLHLAASKATFQQCAAILKASPIQLLMTNSDRKYPIDLARERVKSLTTRLLETKSDMHKHEDLIGIKNLIANRCQGHPEYAILLHEKNKLEKQGIPEAERIVTLLQPPSYSDDQDDTDY
jgi:hypothetical protein